MSFFRGAPRTLRKAQLDNIALVPGSLLPFRARYQALANALPQGSVLICLPKTSERQRTTLLTAAFLLESRGHQVKVVEAAHV